MRKFFVIIITTCICYNFSTVPYSGIDQLDFKYLYNPDAEVNFNHQISYYPDSVIIVLKIQIKSELYELSDYVFTNFYVNDYQEKLSYDLDTLNQTELLIAENENSYYLRILTNQIDGILTLYVHNRHNQKDFYYDIPLNKDQKFGNYDIKLVSLKNEPILSNYLKESDSFKIETQSNDFVYVYYYSRNFEMAEAPMITSAGSVNPNLNIDSSFILKANKSYSLKNNGLYFLQSDSSNVFGLGIRVTDHKYPRLTKIDDVIESLRYFSTRSEWALLTGADEKKKALDSYWLSVTNSPEKARNIIRNYFSRINDANYYFTNYKEGWKTDMGMIYVIFGIPDLVNRSDESEIWTYEKNAEFPKMKFSFVRSPNIFSNEHYVLIRDTMYEDLWYQAVDFWRKGKFKDINAE